MAFQTGFGFHGSHGIQHTSFTANTMTTMAGPQGAPGVPGLVPPGTSLQLHNQGQLEAMRLQSLGHPRDPLGHLMGTGSPAVLYGTTGHPLVTSSPLFDGFGAQPVGHTAQFHADPMEVMRSAMPSHPTASVPPHLTASATMPSSWTQTGYHDQTQVDPFASGVGPYSTPIDHMQTMNAQAMHTLTTRANMGVRASQKKQKRCAC